ncbi:hypothetical protein GWI33_014923 [Rhynchophorus ferrugineus]|uniref:Uncharacterized protein n=1 Tax=Rhynchophorus ferrugineus TaxID=354439 RepID=A0A834I0F9_RHYFE|nr:hypothetical protein GWI33_014923 [Rhynchophorus ferrugineus]
MNCCGNNVQFGTETGKYGLFLVIRMFQQEIAQILTLWRQQDDCEASAAAGAVGVREGGGGRLAGGGDSFFGDIPDFFREVTPDREVRKGEGRYYTTQLKKM